MRPTHWLAAAVLAALSCPAPTMAAEITVFAAASLKTALDKAGTEWQAARGDRVTISYAGSPQLARQIQQGAPADVFISAAPEWMDSLERDGLIDPASRRDLLGNRLVLVAPADAAAALDPAAPGALAARLGHDGKLAMALVDSVPAGVYGKAALTHLGQWDTLAPQVAQAENVRAALALVARGEAPLGIVYATDAHAEPKVAVVAAFPADSHPPIIYPAALVRQGNQTPPPEAAAFLSALTTAPARAAFENEGFVILPASANPAPADASPAAEPASGAGVSPAPTAGPAHTSNRAPAGNPALEPASEPAPSPALALTPAPRPAVAAGYAPLSATPADSTAPTKPAPAAP